MRVWLVVVFGLAAGCSTSRAGGSVAPSSLTITVATDRAKVGPGEQLRITVSVTNNSASSRTLRFSSGCQTDFEFLDAQGKVARASMQRCSQSLTQRTLAAGATFDDAHIWTRGPLDPPQLAAGTYEVRGLLLATGENGRSKPVVVSIP